MNQETPSVSELAKLFALVSQTLSKISLAEWYRKGGFAAELHTEAPDNWAKVRFRVEYWEPDSETGDEELQRGRWWYVEDYFTEQDIVKAAWAALSMSDEHRRREGFRYNGHMVFSPHSDISLPRTEAVHGKR